MNANQFARLRDATPERAKSDGKELVILFSNGAKLEVSIELEFTGGGYDFQDAFLVVDVVPPPAEQDGWIVMEGDAT